MKEIKTAEERTCYPSATQYDYRIALDNERNELRFYIKQLEQELASANEQLAEAKQDQARYQFLRNRALGIHKDDAVVIGDFAPYYKGDGEPLIEGQIVWSQE